MRKLPLYDHALLVGNEDMDGHNAAALTIFNTLVLNFIHTHPLNIGVRSFVLHTAQPSVRDEVPSPHSTKPPVPSAATCAHT